MRAPRRKRPRRRSLVPAPTGCDVSAVAGRTLYVGSVEHKDTPSFAGWPRPRADATICDRSFSQRQDEIAKWLRDAILHGHTGDWQGGFPRYVWHRLGDKVYEARLVNPGNGEYKAYELTRDEWPTGI